MIEISLFCVGLYILTHDFFSFLRINELEDKLLEYPILWFIYKPILGCPTCMASFWSFIFLREISITLVVTAFGVACLNSILFKIYNYLK